MPDPHTPPRWFRELLPGDLRPARGKRRSMRDWVVDALIALICVAVTATLALQGEFEQRGEAVVIVNILGGLAAFAALWWRRSDPWPVGVFVTVLSSFTLTAGTPAVVAIFNIALRGTRRELCGVWALSVVATIIGLRIYPNVETFWAELAIGLLMGALVVFWGLLVRAQREQLDGLRERSERLATEQRLRVEQARLAERRRIAREMHDVLAHRVSLLSLHAGALEYRRDVSAEEVAQAAAVIRATAHAALDDLREVLGVLRDEDGTAAPERPQPTLADIPALVREGRAAGMEIDSAIEVDADAAIPATIGRSVYRIVQEGLTNARKHAPHSRVEIAVATTAEQLTVTVRSRRPVGVAAGAAPPPPGAGMGLTGLAERVALAGGRFEHGPDDSGDFVVHASLPL